MKKLSDFTVARFAAAAALSFLTAFCACGVNTGGSAARPELSGGNGSEESRPDEDGGNSPESGNGNNNAAVPPENEIRDGQKDGGTEAEPPRETPETEPPETEQPETEQPAPEEQPEPEKQPGVPEPPGAEPPGAEIPGGEKPSEPERKNPSLSNAPNGSYAIGKPFYNYVFDCYGGAKLDMNTLLSGCECVLLNFYYTGCGYCNDEWENIKAARAVYGQKVAVVCLNVLNEPESAVEAHRLRYGLPFIFAKGADLAGYFNARSSPTSVIIGGDGTVREKAVGEQSAAWFRSVFGKYTAE